MAAETRTRILAASEVLFRRQGYAAVGMKQIVSKANAPFGSIYHFFPGGKQQLCAEVVFAAGRVYGELITTIFDPADDMPTGFRNFFSGAAMVLEASGYQDACPIAVIALEAASTNEPIRQATHQVFNSWVDLLSKRLVQAGATQTQATDFAQFALATLEGAFMLARAARSTQPIRSCGEFVADAAGRLLSLPVPDIVDADRIDAAHSHKEKSG